MKLRPANVHDLETLLFWDTQPHVIDSDPNDDWNWEVELKRNPEWREQLIAETDEGRPIGFIQIIDPLLEESHYWGDVEPNKRAIDIWIGLAQDLNKGYGTEMMNLAIERCFQHPEVNEIIIDPLKSNTKAHRFYKRLGFEFVEERKLNEDVCFIFSLKRQK
jgi:aminoglycoside 6'-N-acetyltransferase